MWTAAALTLALAAAGCAGDAGTGDGVATAGGPASASASGRPTRGDVADKMRAFAACMREQGIDMPDPQVDADGRVGMQIRGGAEGDPDKLTGAQQTCAHLMPQGDDLPKPDAAAIEKMRAMAKCMRENGVPNFPDPSADGRIEIKPDSGFDPADPTVREAQKKCDHFGPTLQGGGAGR